MIERICRLSGEKFVIERADLEFYAKMGVITEEQLDKLASLEVGELASEEAEKNISGHSEFISESSDEEMLNQVQHDRKGLEAEKIPSELLIGLPTLCPEERQRKRMAWRNERTLYKRKCSATNKDVISVHPSEAPFPVYSHEYFFGDDWNALDYGQDFDFSRPFFEQFLELQSKVPRIINFAFSNENAEYGNLASWNKDCYMCFEADNNQGCLYCGYTFRCVDTIDCTHVTESELCSHCIECHHCYNLSHSIDCKNCSESYFLKNCIGCKNCFGCVNLRQKEYYWLNKKLTKEEYYKKLQQFKLGSNVYKQKCWNDFIKFSEKFPVKFIHGLNNEEVLGDYIYNSKNAYSCFDASELQDCKYCCNLERSKDAYDIDIYGGVEGAELVYECHAVGRGAFDVAFGNMVYQQLQNVWYSDTCAFSKNLFGCISVYHKKYCILNKQYTKEEYEALVPKIIEHMKQTGEWGEFFPTSLSPFAYNETVAQEYYPLTKAEALKKGYRWKDEVVNKKHEALQKEFDWKSVPDDIKDVEDSILNQILFCQRSKKPYKIQKAELKFYRKMNLPIPRLHPDERHKDRMKLRNPRKLYKRKCADCGKEIQTTFAPDRPEKILCEACYLKMVD